MRGSFRGWAVVVQWAALTMCSACWEDPQLGGAGALGFTEFVPLELPPPDVRGSYEVTTEENVGAGFENTPSSSEQAVELACDQLGGTDATGPVVDESLYTLFRPTHFQSGVRYPVVAWDGARCGVPATYGALLSHIVSHGFIVIAPNARWNGSGVPPRRGIDWVLRQNGNPESSLYGRVNVTQIAVLGHTQAGGAAAAAVGGDVRVDTTVLINGGSPKDLRGPVLIMTAEHDPWSQSGLLAFTETSVPAAFIDLRSTDAQAVLTETRRVAGPVTAWLRYQLWGDATGRSWFIGSNCGLCGRAEVYLRSKGLP